jgi:RNA polymerase sigma factor (sigma-70 family)
MIEQPQTVKDLAAKRAAFERALDENGAYFLAIFKKQLRKRADIEDLNQAFWMQVYKTFTTHQLSQFGLLQNKSKQVLANYFRYAGVRSIVTITDELPDAIGQQAPSPRDEIEAKRMFWGLFPTTQLSEGDRELFWLRANDECTYKDISERLKIPVSTVQDRFAKICDTLREAYNQE